MIGRFVLYTIIGLLALFVLGATFLLDHGGGFTSVHSPVSIHHLRMLPDVYEGRTVSTEGTLHHSPDLDLYEVVDEEGQAIVVTGQGDQQLEPMLGKTVTVTGKFKIDPEDGIIIEAESVGLIH